MRHRHACLPAVILALLLCFPCALAESPQAPLPGAAGYWPADVSEELLHTAAWRYDTAGHLDGLSVLSVSPSGQYIAAADRQRMDLSARNSAGVANPLGRLPDAVHLFVRSEDGYVFYKSIPVDVTAQLELSSLLGGGSAFAWNESETRIAVTGDWGAYTDMLSYFSTCHNNLYLLELEDGSVRRLTRNSEPQQHCVLPQWAGDGALRYVRISATPEWENTLCEMDPETGEEKKLANLYTAEGAASIILSWQAHGEKIYYTADSIHGQSGFFVSPFGAAEKDARCLIDLFPELRATGRHPYCRQLCRLEISRDGRWACLGIEDPRVLNRDFPLADDPLHPQADPANAVSMKNGRPWVPCHNVLLYDLEKDRLANPFADRSLAPAKTIVTAAAFSPDGQSLLCALFGDGGPWQLSDFTRTTFCQISLTDGRFTPIRVFETELESSVWFPKGFRWLDNNVLCIPTGSAPFTPVQLIRPAVFLQYPENPPVK